MTCQMERTDFALRTLDGEWERIGMILTLAECRRNGSEPGDGFGDRLAELMAAVGKDRLQGTWSGLGRVIDEDLLENFLTLDIDLLALALAPVARPAFGLRVQALQSPVASPFPSLALVQDLLLLDAGPEVDMLYDRLDLTAPLVVAGLVEIRGEGPYQTLHPTSLAQRAVLGRTGEITAPPGATPELRRGRWDDLILPDPVMRRLRDYTAWIRHKDRIAGWGGRPAAGPLALFSGGSGTGKSFAASIVAGELTARTGASWALYTLDLGRVMSKYVGETEENLNRLLDALDGKRAILQIDEADGLLGKRGEVSDARDRYANLEVSHLLSRFERHAGPVILTTNLRANIDPAFLRRFQMVVDFPSPDVASRAALWSALLPPTAPRCPRLDIAELADAARLSGGAIRNAAHYAAVLAAEDDRPIAAAHVARAVWAELAKENRLIRRSEIGSLARHLEEA